jgi:Ca2+/Na+ antiporter
VRRDTQDLEYWLLGVAAVFGVTGLVLMIFGEPVSLPVSTVFLLLVVAALILQHVRHRA